MRYRFLDTDGVYHQWNAGDVGALAAEAQSEDLEIVSVQAMVPHDDDAPANHFRWQEVDLKDAA